jgi:hypothetical protein
VQFMFHLGYIAVAVLVVWRVAHLVIRSRR